MEKKKYVHIVMWEDSSPYFNPTNPTQTVAATTVDLDTLPPDQRDELVGFVEFYENNGVGARKMITYQSILKVLKPKNFYN